MGINVFPTPSAGGSGGGRYERVVAIKSTQSWTVPSDVTSIECFLIAGGGGGGSTGTGGWPSATGGGGSGGARYDVLTVTPNTAYTITVGAGGGRGNDGGGAQGGTSSFGALLSQTGGFGGSWNPNGGSNSGANGNNSGGSSGGRQLGSTTFSGIYPATAGLLGMAGGGETAGVPANGGGGSYGSAGTANTGGGGGGGGNGGSGIVILRYWSAV
jgi:hypothetical protein